MILITDLDHTLAASSWRDQHRGGNWDAYHEMAKDDPPILPMISLINALSLGAKIVCITTRPEKWRTLTMNWLLKHLVDIDELLMRPNDDFRPSPVLKVALAQQFLVEDENVVAIDDREDVLQAYRAVGIKALLRKL
jgi:beta-phosphoglucomutase-like phosphatase (HAD superfamily)